MPAMQTRTLRALALSVAAGLMVLAGPTAAGAATTIGQTFTPPAGGCGSGTDLQTTSPGSSYAAPADGVITSWSHQANETPPELQFKVARSVGGNDYTIVGESTSQAMTAGELNTFPTRIPVQAGDVIGFHVGTTGSCIEPTAAGFGYHYLFANVAAGTTTGFFDGGGGGGQLDVSAELEPDADADGFGDETQDQCPADAGPGEGCPADSPNPNPPLTNPPTVKPTGKRAAALRKCKRIKKKTKSGRKARKKCKRKAKRLPI
jgi:hypothetical protein